MKRTADIKNLPVISIGNGELLGEVEDIVFQPQNNEFLGLVINVGRDKYFVKVKDIYKIGRDIVVINGAVNLSSLDNMKDGAVHGDWNQSPLGETVVTSSGNKLGSINDLVIDEDNYSIVGYEMSSGMVQDLLNGRNILPLDRKITYGKDALILEEEE